MKATRRDKRIQSLNFQTPGNIDKVTQVTEFLKNNYQIEINKFDPTQMRIRSLNKAYVYHPSLNDVLLHMIQEAIPHTETIVKRILKSPNYTKVYDPLKEYFDGVRKITVEESQIDKLIRHIKVREFSDKPEGYYQERASRLMRKWLVGSAACATGNYANEAALVFVGEREGSGKTSLSKFLCPSVLREMMTISSSDRRAFSFEQAVTANFLVLYDEMCGLTPSTAEEFKKAMSAQSLLVKDRGDICALSRPRIGSVIATTNNLTGSKQGFLHRAMGTRRFICVHIEDIDFEYSNVVDIDMLWAEAIQLSENPNYSYKLTQEDYAEFDEINQRYIIETPAGTLIQQAYDIPTANDDDAESVWMNATDIMMELKSHGLIKSDISKFITPKHIGEAMQRLGFHRSMIYGNGERLYKYHVKRLNG